MAAGIAIVLVMALLAIFAPLLFTSDPTAVAPRERFTPPSEGHWFGTDNIGRDLWSRVLYGSRVSMTVGVAVAAISVLSSIVFGLLAGYYRRLDAFIMRIMDGLMAIPSVLLAMALMALLGGSVQNVIIALCVVETPRAVRVVRASVLSIREEMFVDAAHALGVPPTRVLRAHILPNTFAPLIVQASFIAASAVLVEAYLSFVGAGPPPEVPSWGNIMAEGRHYISRFVWMIVFPGVFLTLTVLGINLAGDGLRDSLDPKLRSRM
jgi:peptide/nickel transport system permease protein